MAKVKENTLEYRNYYLPINFPVMLLSGDNWRISDIPSGRLHFHNCLEIGICHSDHGIMKFYDESLEFHAGDVTCVPRNIPHTTYSAPGTASLWSYIFLDPSELFHNIIPMNQPEFQLSSFTFQNFQPILPRTEYPDIYLLANLLIHKLSDQKAMYQLESKGLLLSLYTEFLHIQNRENRGVPDLSEFPDNMLVIAPALDYIEDNYSQQFTIEMLADICHISPTHFRRIFHNIMRTSPLDYLNNTRIMNACNQLRATDESILNIAENVGFRSISSFNRYFARIMQTTPREYRAKMQQNGDGNKKASILEYTGWMFPESLK